MKTTDYIGIEALYDVMNMDDSPLEFCGRRKNRETFKYGHCAWGSNSNFYIGIRNSNLVILHVEKSNCIIVPKEITDNKGNIIDVVSQLQKRNWRLVNNGRVSDNNGFLISRAIMSLKYKGSLDNKIESKYDVHHKGVISLNTEESLLMVTKKQHKQIHRVTSKKTHHSGRIIYTSEELLRYIEDMKNLNDYLNNRPY